MPLYRHKGGIGMIGHNYYPSYQQQMQAPQIQVPAQSNDGIVWVQGESGAKSFLVAPNKSVLLMDSESEKFYIKTSDASGMPLPLRVFKYEEVKALNEPNTKPEDYVTRTEYEDLISKIEDIEKSMKKPTTRAKKEEEDG